MAQPGVRRVPRGGRGDLCEMFGLVPQIPGRTWHDGLYDAVACASLALHMTSCL